MATDVVDDLSHARAAIIVAFVAKRGNWFALTPEDCARFDALADDYTRETRRFERELGLAPDDDGGEEQPK